LSPERSAENTNTIPLSRKLGRNGGNDMPLKEPPFVQVCFYPYITAKRLASDKIDVGEPIRLYFLSIAVAGTIAKMLGCEISNPFSVYPVIDQLLNCLLWLLPALLFAGVNHLVLTLAGGKGRFRHAFYSQLYVVGITLPITTLIEGIALKVPMSDGIKTTIMKSLYEFGFPFLNFQFARVFLSACYGVTPRRIEILVWLVVPLLVLVTFFLGVFVVLPILSQM
jgi:hypothetical protein